MKKENFNIAKVGGYMLKLVRAKNNIDQFKDEFRCIRHGHYDSLIELVKARFPDEDLKSPILVAYRRGDITTLVSHRDCIVTMLV